MRDEFEEARERARSVIEATWRRLAESRTVGWGGPPSVVADRYPFVRSGLGSLGTRVVEDLPVLIFQSRESPPQAMDVAIPYRDDGGNPFNSRLLCSTPHAPEDVHIKSDFAQAVWFLIQQQVLPSPRTEAFGRTLAGMTGRRLFELDGP
jgi:hypothetical protein